MLPSDAKARKRIPLATGLIDYFPDALAAVAELSQVGNDQHNPGQPLHWSRGKSDDHDDCLLRHFIERGMKDTDGVRHSAKVAWRALALLQLELEAARDKEVAAAAGGVVLGPYFVGERGAAQAYDANPGSLNLPSDADGS